MTKLKFFDLKTRKPFITEDFKIEVFNGRRRAVAISPSGFKAVRFVSKEFVK